jgi:hypothetical protein
LRDLPSKWGGPRSGCSPDLFTEKVPAVRLHEHLDGAHSVRPALAYHSRRDPRPAQDLAELVRRDLALVKAAGWEIPKWRLAPRRLVDDHEAGWGMRVQLRQEGVIGGSPQQADELQVRKLCQEAFDRGPPGFSSL